MSAGAEIRRLRGSLSAKDAALYIGVKPERLRKWEQRDADPKDSDDIRAVQDYFGVPLNRLGELDNFQFVPRGEVQATVEKNALNRTSLERTLENLSEDKLKSTAIIERLVTLLEKQLGGNPGPQLVAPGTANTMPITKGKNEKTSQ